MHQNDAKRPLQLALIGAGLFTKDAYLPLCRSVLLNVNDLRMPPALANAYANRADDSQPKCKSAQYGAVPSALPALCLQWYKST